MTEGISSLATDARLPLVLLPGTACDHRVFEPLIAGLGDYPIIIGELAGSRTMPELAQSLLAALPPKFLLAGFSLGGICALEMVAHAPQRMSKLALIDTTARPDPPENAVVRRKAVARARKEGMQTYILDSWDRLVAPVNIDDPDLCRTIVEMANDCGPDRLADQAEAAIHRADSRLRLAAITLPTLVMAGAQEQVCSLDAQYEMANGIACADFHIIEDAGHFAPLERPDALLLHIHRWLGEDSSAA